MRFRPEVAAAILRMASGQPSPREIVAEIERAARENGIDEMKLAYATGRFWGRLFKELEALQEARA